jgi:Fe-S cluster assembly protein SufB
VLNGEDSVGEFYSVAVTNNYQQADTGTKMIHNGKGSRSTIVSKGISAGHSQNTYRGLVRVAAAEGVRNFTQCDSCCWARPAARTPCPISRCATQRHHRA